MNQQSTLHDVNNGPLKAKYYKTKILVPSVGISLGRRSQRNKIMEAIVSFLACSTELDHKPLFLSAQ